MSATIGPDQESVAVHESHRGTGTGKGDGEAAPQRDLHLIERRADRNLDSIAIRIGDRYTLLRLQDVDWIEADGNYSRLHVKGRIRLVTRNLATLEKDVLDPHVFTRVHRSAIVNTKRIAALEVQGHADAMIILDDGTRISCSRRYRMRLQRRIYFCT